MRASGIKDWVSAAAMDLWYLSQLPITEGFFCTLAGNGTRKISPTSGPFVIERFEKTIAKIEARLIVWRDVYARPRQIVYLSEPYCRPTRQKISPLSTFSIFDVCASCGGNKWLPAKMAGKEHAMCYSCVAPNQYRSFGAVPMDLNLIEKFMRAEECRTKSFTTSGIATAV